MFQFTQPKRAATDQHKDGRITYKSFNSRSPSGLRPVLFYRCLCRIEFQFTQPKRAATRHLFGIDRTLPVSIHAAQAGCDRKSTINTSNHDVSIHAAQAGCDQTPLEPSPILLVSIHAAQAGCDVVMPTQE